MCVCVGGGNLETAVCNGVACRLWASATRNLSLRCSSSFLMVIVKLGKDFFLGGGGAGERLRCVCWGGNLETAVCSGVACRLWASATRNLSLRCSSSFSMVIVKLGKNWEGEGQGEGAI